MCSEFLKEFSIDDQSKLPQLVGILEIQSGIANTLKIYHLFMIFPMMVNIHYRESYWKRRNSGSLTEIIDAKEPPKAYGITIYACEDSLKPGFSSSLILWLRSKF
jgi:hypothetical protein